MGVAVDRAAQDFDRLLADYDYALPETAIAQRPVEPRDAARLLILGRARAELREARVRDLHRLLSPGDLLVVNDTRVLRARLCGRKRGSGGRAEILLLRPIGGAGRAGGSRPGRERGALTGPAGADAEGSRGAAAGERWETLLQASGRLRPGLAIDLEGGFAARLVAPAEGIHWEVEIEGPGPVLPFLERCGHVPLPPYIRRPDDETDGERYQTIYAARPGAVAAPTAGLHFTPGLLAALAGAGVEIARVTLHVGAGTFEPLSPEQVARGELHPETYELPGETADAIAALRARGGRLVAVGTTTARVLESCAAPAAGGALPEGDAPPPPAAGGGAPAEPAPGAFPARAVRPGRGETRLFIRPPYEPRVVDALLTNFHLPRSSLFMLVAAFAGRERLLAAYAEALRRGYRFYSYGDAMLIA
ncbi:MAG: S-adenosylmethionine:tRNA ribosyltransferase-isomerase [Candidatus Eisenbacteria bacterium]|uniref:S-adenosylmethionine:tRNA ribosyltransferase-isomerase n=1 Tax=Eiseniibacteriota bacterium TaxID=2212470 RepID=A0A937X638_UNCEI|nr:S-adenosylmethionine:tRNA ribosyltransferase-isomerase [Candidatus Eisenbacteria bacterium]